MDVTFFKEGNRLYVINKPEGFKKLLHKFNLLELKECGSCEINTMPGCSGIAIITKFKIDTSFQDKGVGSKLLEEAIIQCKLKNYSQLMATVNNESPKMHTILQKAGFKPVSNFLNIKSNREVTVYIL